MSHLRRFPSLWRTSSVSFQDKKTVSGSNSISNPLALKAKNRLNTVTYTNIAVWRERLSHI